MVRRAHRHRVPLGLVLLSTGAVTHGDLRRALALQHGTGERIGDVLRRECGLSERQVAEALALQWGCGLETMAAGYPDAMVRVAPHALLERTGMLPVRIGRNGRIHVAFAHSVDSQAVFALQRMHAVPVTAGIAPIDQWNDGRSRIVQRVGVGTHELDCADVAEMEREVARMVRRLQPVESRWARVHDLHWLRLWLEPAALTGGPTQREDVLDFVYRVLQPALPALR